MTFCEEACCNTVPLMVKFGPKLSYTQLSLFMFMLLLVMGVVKTAKLVNK